MKELLAGNRRAWVTANRCRHKLAVTGSGGARTPIASSASSSAPMIQMRWVPAESSADHPRHAWVVVRRYPEHPVRQGSKVRMLTDALG